MVNAELIDHSRPNAMLTRSRFVPGPWFDDRKERLKDFKPRRPQDPPIPLAIQICFDYRHIPQKLSVASALYDRIAALRMNESELSKFCTLLKYSSDADELGLMRLALEIMERQLDGRFANFQFDTGHHMAATFETKFYAFVTEASNHFDMGIVNGIWKRINPFERVEIESVCGVRTNPPRLSRDGQAWSQIKELWSEYPEWTRERQIEFCRIVREDFQFLKDQPRLDKSLGLFVINKSMPYINDLCGNITRVFATGANLAMIDGLVAEAGKEMACPVITQWNTNGTMTEIQLVNDLVRAGTPRAHDDASGVIRRIREIFGLI